MNELVDGIDRFFFFFFFAFQFHIIANSIDDNESMYVDRSNQLCASWKMALNRFCHMDDCFCRPCQRERRASQGWRRRKRKKKRKITQKMEPERSEEVLDYLIKKTLFLFY